MKDKYYTLNFYYGKGVCIEVVPECDMPRTKWSWRPCGSRIWFTGYRDKFHALLEASWKNGRSMKDMEWKPIAAPEEK